MPFHASSPRRPSHPGGGTGPLLTGAYLAADEIIPVRDDPAVWRADTWRHKRFCGTPFTKGTSVSLPARTFVSPGRSAAMATESSTARSGRSPSPPAQREDDAGEGHRPGQRRRPVRPPNGQPAARRHRVQDRKHGHVLLPERRYSRPRQVIGSDGRTYADGGGSQLTYNTGNIHVADCTNFANERAALAPGQSSVGCVVVEVPAGVTVTTVRYSDGGSVGQWTTS